MKEHLINKIQKLSEQMGKYNLAENMLLLNSRRYLLINFWSGLSRGVGTILGATILGAIIIMILQKLVVLNLPLVGDFIAGLVRIVLEHL